MELKVGKQNKSQIQYHHHHQLLPLDRFVDYQLVKELQGIQKMYTLIARLLLPS